MKKVYIMAVVFLAFVAVSSPLSAGAEDGARLEPNQLFYNGNRDYEKRDYAKAIEEYMKIVDLGIESGNLYYNLGNAFMKSGKIGYAVLYYEKAKRLMPGDSDLRSNLAYARSLAGDSELQIRAQKRLSVKIIERPFRHLTLNSVAITVVILYLILIAIQIISVVSPQFKRKSVPIFVAVLILFIFDLSAFAARYYEEKMLQRGTVVQKAVECKYEPIDASTTYYTLSEGSDCYILKTRNGWRQIKRPDGRVGWVKKEAVGEI